MAGGSLAEQASLKAELSELKAKIREARREVGGIPAPVASSVGASPSNAANGDSELRQLDKKMERAKHDITEMRDMLDTFGETLDFANRLSNMNIDLTARLDKQVEENAVLDRLVSRHSLQLAAMSLNATQMEELKRLQKQSAELHDQMRAAQVKANDLSRQVHHVSLQWTKTCNRREKLRRGLAEKGAAPAAPSSDEVRAATALEKMDARLEKATKALKVAIQAGVGSARRQQQRMQTAVNELKELRTQAAALASRLDAEGVPPTLKVPSPDEIEAFTTVAEYDTSRAVALQGELDAAAIERLRSLEAQAKERQMAA